ncbi:MAG TPA: peptidoglycan-binding domain-containing protein [Chthoniobacterales bacterium]|nr:peptidoglycan-binding domain-containing protein [Chthoniobacterales bacterium]
MICKKPIVATIAVTVCIFGGSNAMANGHGGSGGGGFAGGGRGGGFAGGGRALGGTGFNSGGFRGGFNGGGFRGGFNGRDFSGRGLRDGGFRGDRFRHRRFNDFVFFGDFGDPFFYDTYPYYGYYPYGYGYNSYDQPVYQGSAGYTDSLTGQVQLRLARAGYYHGAIDGVSGNATRRAIRGYERAHNLPADGQIRGRLLTTMGLG